MLELSDRERLLAAFDSGELVRPSPEVPNVVDLANALPRVADSGAPRSPAVASIVDAIGPVDHVVFVLVDGLGMNVIDAEHGAAFLGANVAAELMTVFPSTTPTVLTSYATGLWPSQHGVPNWHLYLEEIDAVATIIHFIRRGDDRDLASLGLTPEQAYPEPSIVPGMAWPSFGIVPEGIGATPYSSYCRGHTPHYGYKGLEDAAGAVLKWLSEAQGSTFTQVYIPHVDAASHEYGIDHDVAKQAVSGVDGWLAQLAGLMPPNVAIVISADHGLLNTPDEHVHEIEPDDELLRHLAREPWGTGRATMFQAREDRTAEFETSFRERLGDDFYLLETDEVLDLGLMGPGPAAHVTRRRIGSHLAVSRGTPVIDYKYPREEQDEHKSVASHGGLTPDEMRVPLIVART